jgi:uncharacterized membrane protein
MALPSQPVSEEGIMSLQKEIAELHKQIGREEEEGLREDIRKANRELKEIKQRKQALEKDALKLTKRIEFYSGKGGRCLVSMHKGLT